MAAKAAALNHELDCVLAVAQHANRARPAKGQRMHEGTISPLATEGEYVDYMKRLGESLQLNQSLNACLAEKDIDASCIERLSDTLQHILQRVIPISMQTMPYTTAGQARPRYREETTHCRLQRLAQTQPILY